MDHATELSLIDELLDLKAAKRPFMDEQVAFNPARHYTDPGHFFLETERLMRALPRAVLHRSEIADPGSFRRLEIAGLPVLVTRDRDGVVHAFLNVCRHRGARLVEEESGCRHRFKCPYHAWTYAGSGELVGGPHFDIGFGDLDKTTLSLRSLPVHEAFGFVWLVADPGGSFDFDAYLAPLGDELAALDMADMTIVAQDRPIRAANWKIIIEGGIEAYHFRVAHRATIGPYFEDNLSTYRCFGPHMRAVLPRVSMATLSPDDRDQWHVRDHANVLYTLFPLSQWLVQKDHIVWIGIEPLSPDRTMLRLVTLAPTHVTQDPGYWQRNHQITMATLDEDFTIGEGIQAGLASGANTEVVFGRFEGALARFNQTIATSLRS